MADGDAAGAAAASVPAGSGLVGVGLGLAVLVADALLPADADALSPAVTAAAWPAENPSFGRIRKATRPMASATQPAARMGARLRRRDAGDGPVDTLPGRGLRDPIKFIPSVFGHGKTTSLLISYGVPEAGTDATGRAHPAARDATLRICSQTTGSAGTLA